jgi:hypothetical protein
VWDALYVEQGLYQVVRQITGEDLRVHSVSKARKMAVAHLRHVPATSSGAEAEAWLVKATTALEKRNKVLHSTPAISGVPRPTAEDLRLLWWPKKIDLQANPPVIPAVLDLATLQQSSACLDEAWRDGGARDAPGAPFRLCLRLAQQGHPHPVGATRADAAAVATGRS